MLACASAFAGTLDQYKELAAFCKKNSAISMDFLRSKTLSQTDLKQFIEIADLSESVDFKGKLEAALTMLNDAAKQRPTGIVKEGDVRRGDIIFNLGEIKSSVNQHEATDYCKDKGERVPTKEELNENRDLLPLYEWFWSSSLYPSGLAYIVNIHGYIDVFYGSYSKGSVVCVLDAVR